MVDMQNAGSKMRGFRLHQTSARSPQLRDRQGRLASWVWAEQKSSPCRRPALRCVMRVSWIQFSGFSGCRQDAGAPAGDVPGRRPALRGEFAGRAVPAPEEAKVDFLLGPMEVRAGLQ